MAISMSATSVDLARRRLFVGCWIGRRCICLFAKPLYVGFGLLLRFIDVLAYFGDVLVIGRWLYIDDKALFISCANNPPIRDSRISQGKQEDAYQ